VYESQYAPNRAGLKRRGRRHRHTSNGTSYVYSAGATGIVNAIFTPKYAGLRYGAVVLEIIPDTYIL
jgi:hypothetical protein